jgi:hypothetical protein
MKKIFGMISTFAAIFMITRHTAEFVSTHYWWFAAILLIGIAGQVFISIKGKNGISKT